LKSEQLECQIESLNEQHDHLIFQESERQAKKLAQKDGENAYLKEQLGSKEAQISQLHLQLEQFKKIVSNKGHKDYERTKDLEKQIKDLKEEYETKIKKRVAAEEEAHREKEAKQQKEIAELK